MSFRDSDSITNNSHSFDKQSLDNRETKRQLLSQELGRFSASVSKLHVTVESTCFQVQKLNGLAQFYTGMLMASQQTFPEPSVEEPPHNEAVHSRNSFSQ